MGFLPGLQATSLANNDRPSFGSVANDSIFGNRYSLQQKFRSRNGPMAMAIPGYGLTEQIVVGGFANFLSVYNLVITGRVLLSWFPQAQGIAALQPVFAVTDPYLNLFRGIISPIFGLDLSPILAFVTLNLLQSSAVSLAADFEPELKEKLTAQTKRTGGEKLKMSQQRKKLFWAVKRGLSKICEV